MLFPKSHTYYSDLVQLPVLLERVHHCYDSAVGSKRRKDFAGGADAADSGAAVGGPISICSLICYTSVILSLL